MPKRNKVEYLQHIFAIQMWIIEGVQPALIVRQIIQNGWTQAQKQVDRERCANRMLKEARDAWAAVEMGNIEQQRILKIAELEQRKRGLKEVFKGTPRGMLAQLAHDKTIIALQGLNRPIKFEHSGPDGQPLPSNTNTQVILYLPQNGRELPDAATNTH